MGHIVTAGYVTVETAVPGGRAQVDIPRGHTLPDDVPAEQVSRLVELGDIAAFAVERVDEEPEVEGGPVEPGPADGTIADVLDRVGSDPAKARVAFEAEQAKGDKARTTLLGALADITGE